MSREQKRGTWATIRRLEKSVPQVSWYRGELVLMTLFINIFALGLPIFILQVYDRVLPNLGLTTMQFLVIGLIAVMLLDFLMKTIRAAVTTYTGARFEHLARVSAVDHILRTPQDIYEQDTPGAYLDKVNAIGVVKDFYSSQLGTLMIDLPFAIFFLGMIWFLGGIIVAVPLTLLTLFGIMAIIIGGNLRRAVDTRSQVDNKRYDFLIEIITGIHTVKAQAFKNLLQRRFETMQEFSARAVRSVAMQSSIAQSLGSTFGQLNMACVIGTGAILVIDGNLSAGELAACTLLSGRAMQPLQSAMGLWTNFQTIRVACDNASEVLELPAEDTSGLPDMPKIKGGIEFRNVTFGYRGMTEPLIKDLNVDINAGEMIGIEGENSSGRSTLLKLMIGLIRPNNGQVLVDGHDLAKHKSTSYRRQMAFLSADADVYSGTILDNMTYFRGGKYINKAIKLAREIGLDDEIKRLPEGYGTHVGDGAGGVLPAGFVQRITVVRALVDDPRIIFFDNANHGLDSQTDRLLMDFISGMRGRATVILVSARPSWLRLADRRYVMTDGRLTQKREEKDPQTHVGAPRGALPAPEAPAQQATSAPTQAPAQTPAVEKAAPQPKVSPAPVPSTKPAPQQIAAQQQNPDLAPSAKPTSQQETSAQTPKAAPAPAARPAAKQAAAPTPEHHKTAPAPAAKPAVKQAPQQPKTALAPAARPVAKQAPQQPKTAPAPAARPVAKQAPQRAAAPATQQPKKASSPTAEPAATPTPRPKAAPAPAARPAPRPTAAAQPKGAQTPASKPMPTPTPRPKNAPTQAAKPNPTARPSAVTQNKPTPVPAARPAATRQQKPAAQRPAPQPTSKTPASAPAKQSAQPRAAATLRPAARPSGGSATPAVLKPQPPKPRRMATIEPGGTE